MRLKEDMHLPSSLLVSCRTQVSIPVSSSLSACRPVCNFLTCSNLWPSWAVAVKRHTHRLCGFNRLRWCFDDWWMGHTCRKDSQLLYRIWVAYATLFGPGQNVGLFHHSLLQHTDLYHPNRTIILTIIYEILLVGFWFIDHGNALRWYCLFLGIIWYV